MRTSLRPPLQRLDLGTPTNIGQPPLIISGQEQFFTMREEYPANTEDPVAKQLQQLAEERRRAAEEHARRMEEVKAAEARAAQKALEDELRRQEFFEVQRREI